MGIMEDSSDLSETIVKDVTEFVHEQYNIKLDKLIFTVSSQIDLDQNPSHHNHQAIQKLIIKRKKDKFIAYLIIKSKLKCE